MFIDKLAGARAKASSAISIGQRLRCQHANVRGTWKFTRHVLSSVLVPQLLPPLPFVFSPRLLFHLHTHVVMSLNPFSFVLAPWPLSLSLSYTRALVRSCPKPLTLYHLSWLLFVLQSCDASTCNQINTLSPSDLCLKLHAERVWTFWRISLLLLDDGRDRVRHTYSLPLGLSEEQG